MTSAEHRRKAAENKLRRAADRQGYRLEKNRRRDPLAIGYNTWTILDRDTRRVIATDLSLEQVARRLRTALPAD